jgi:hypothetical protein
MAVAFVSSEELAQMESASSVTEFVGIARPIPSRFYSKCFSSLSRTCGLGRRSRGMLEGES